MRITFRARALALAAAIRQAITGRHVYLSTGCLVGRHDYCAAMTGVQGAKRGGRAKFTDAPCICDCHDAGPVHGATGYSMGGAAWRRSSFAH